jgi:UDP-2,4-diacetamido-2,4,6-trideoxy-beta-L-altropyranose hydrolase
VTSTLGFTTVALRVDASTEMGTGHVMRCLTLAEALREGGAEVEFICRELEGNLCDFIERKRHFTVHRLARPDEGRSSDSIRLAHAAWLEVDWQSDAEQTRGVLKRGQTPDWLIVDHYALDRHWEAEVRADVARIMVIDDLADRAHECDLLLDQNVLSDELRYDALVPEYCRMLLGPKFALLRPEFRLARERPQKRTDRAKRVFVFFGGTDPSNETAKALRALHSEEFANLEIAVVIGRECRHHTQLSELVASLPDATLYVQVDNMAQLMSQADVAIGAAGATSWERCYLGLPSVISTIADNQRSIAAALARVGAVCYVGHYNEAGADDIARALRRLLSDSTLRRSMGDVAKEIVDGKGAEHVIRAMSGYKITIVSDSDTWLQPYLDRLKNEWQAEGHEVCECNSPRDVTSGDFAFFLSCSKIVPRHILDRNRHNLVVHESALPQGKGWSPLTWQVLEGKSEIPITLFEAVEEVDSGPIYLQGVIKCDGYELINDLRRSQAIKTINMCLEFVQGFPGIIDGARENSGSSTFYRRRRPDDSRLDPDKTIREQFNLLRVVDNERYPAFFDMNGHRYVIKIEATDGTE